MEYMIPVRLKENDSIVEIAINKQLPSSEGSIIWESSLLHNDLSLMIKETTVDNKEEYQIISKDDAIATSDEEIIASMKEFYLQERIQKTIKEADGFEDEDSSSLVRVENDPYDPKLIRVDPRVFSIQYVCSLIDSGDLNLSTDFQREFVWSDITRKSRLIESLLLRIPIPLFYLLQDEDGMLEVVDGLQRLTVIHDFVNNRFQLKNLEYLKECEGKYYNRGDRGIDPIYVKRIDQTQLNINVIDPQTPEQVRYDIFRRINTGGKTLNNQEIRNCMEKPHVRAFLKSLATMPSFLEATRGSISPQRMADREISLRFVAFYLLDHEMFGQLPYKGDMDAYLDNTISIINHKGKDDLDVIKEAFDKAMKNSYMLFGQMSFRKSVYINKALFLSWSRILCNYEESEIKAIASKTDFYEKLKYRIETDEEYNKALSMSTNDTRRVEFNYKVAKELLEEEML